ncbi:MAG: hypothetical protein ACKOI2_11745 [Actinomycetota bacterium]
MIEILIAASLLGISSGALAMASTSIAPMSRVASNNLDIARELGRIQDLIPLDLARFSDVDVSPAALGQLPGTNVVTLRSGAANNADTSLVSYRYVDVEGEWHLIRFELADESTPPAQATRITVSSHLENPPGGWQPGTSPSHAITLYRSEEPSAYETTMDIYFSSGDRTTTTGTYRLLADAPTPVTEPPVEPTPTFRCGGSITIVVNTASTIWSLGAASTVTTGLTKFVESLRGTPTHLRVIAFDRSAYSFYPDIAIGTYVDMFSSPTSISTLLSRLSTLSTTSTSWRNGRNWEDGIWQASRRDTGTVLAQVPDLIIFITDGSPNRNRTNTTSDTDTTFHEADLTRAVTAAEYARGTGATLMGILLGSGANSTSMSHLTQVFGQLAWEGTTAISPLDRSRTFTQPPETGFSRLEDILGLIGSWRCAGTVTLQQRVLVSGVSSSPTDTWEFDVTASNPTFTRRTAVKPSQPSVTVDIGAGDSAQARTITITQSSRAGYRHHSASCTSSGVTLSIQTVVDSSGAQSILVPAPPRSAVTCLLTAEAVS